MFAVYGFIFNYRARRTNVAEYVKVNLHSIADAGEKLVRCHFFFFLRVYLTPTFFASLQGYRTARLPNRLPPRPSLEEISNWVATVPDVASEMYVLF